MHLTKPALLVSLAVMSTACASAQTAANKEVFFYSAQDVIKAQAKDPAVPKGGVSKGLTWAPASGAYQVKIRRHDDPNAAELHEAHTHVFYILDGKATFVTGGRIQSGKIEGGQFWSLEKGSIIVVPPGVPHWFKEIPADAPIVTFSVDVQAAEAISSHANAK